MAWWSVQSFWHNTAAWQTDGQNHYRAMMAVLCWRTINSDRTPREVQASPYSAWWPSRSIPFLHLQNVFRLRRIVSPLTPLTSRANLTNLKHRLVMATNSENPISIAQRMRRCEAFIFPNFVKFTVLGISQPIPTSIGWNLTWRSWYWSTRPR